MSMHFEKKLPIPAEIKHQNPVSDKAKRIKEERDRELRDIFTGRSGRFLLIIGPCSADNEEAVMEYMERLARVQEQVADRIMIVPRIYTNKPRTTGKGYKGLLHQPDPSKKPDLLAGIIAIRKMHLRVIEQTGLTAADEMLYPENYRYLDDLLGYVAVGARSVEDQQHRMTVSGMDIPAGMKNPTSGDLTVMFNSIVAAQSRHNFIYRGWDVNTDGNALTHVVLRGAVNKHGNCLPNYHYEDLLLTQRLYQEHKLKNPAIVVDCNHSNSNKQHLEQIRIAHEVMHSRSYNESLKTLVKGLMIESYLVEGRQDVVGGPGHCFGQSITDPCLGWEDSEKLIYSIYHTV
ncbi:MAG: 3-deoxy-7-phosphoheptulonate synthase [Lachnospiraceae bacterium]|nr:3-deoxy-7-phosphoheptulonate synthase [Lachnospiraceae bacterium]